MELFDLREPVSACSHGAWLMMSIPSTIFLLRSTRNDRAKQLSMLVFGVSLSLCYGGSALFHGVQGSKQRIALFSQIDHIGIYVLIAGTYTPLAWNLLHGRWRLATLGLAWLAALAGSLLHCKLANVPNEVSTALYLVMGWGAIFCYAEISRKLSNRDLFPLLLGGCFYTVGAALNVLHWPTIAPGVVGSHEVFHILVMCGSVAHFWFMLRVVAPFGQRTPGYTGPGPHLPVFRTRSSFARRALLRLPRLTSLRGGPEVG
jgi:hemolysin III